MPTKLPWSGDEVSVLREVLATLPTKPGKGELLNRFNQMASERYARRGEMYTKREGTSVRNKAKRLKKGEGPQGSISGLDASIFSCSI